MLLHRNMCVVRQRQASGGIFTVCVVRKRRLLIKAGCQRQHLGDFPLKVLSPNRSHPRLQTVKRPVAGGIQWAPLLSQHCGAPLSSSSNSRTPSSCLSWAFALVASPSCDSLRTGFPLLTIGFYSNSHSHRQLPWPF